SANGSASRLTRAKVTKLAPCYHHATARDTWFLPHESPTSARVQLSEPEAMFDFIGMITRVWLATHAPAPRRLRQPALLATQTAAATAAQANANTVVDKVQGFYAHIDQVTAQFRQSVFNSTFGSKKDSDGTVWLKKPGKMRWDYLEKKNTAT